MYSFKRWTFFCSPSTERFIRLKSTAIPIDGAYFLWIPAACSNNYFFYKKPTYNIYLILYTLFNLNKILTFSSSSENPRPVRFLVLYLNVWQDTSGLREPATGRGAMRLAFITLVLCRRIARIGWLNHVFIHLCQSLWKWPFGITLLRFGAIISVIIRNYHKIYIEIIICNCITICHLIIYIWLTNIC